MKVVFLAGTKRDLRNIGDWIARDNPRRAETFVDELEARALTLAEFPLRHQIVAHSSSGPVHKLTHGRYLIYYRVLPDKVEIIQVCHSAMAVPQFE